MARKSKVLEEILNLGELSEKIEDIETFEPDALFVQKISDNAIMIIDERVTGYVIHSVESIILLVIFAIIANCNTFTKCTYSDVFILNG